MAQARHEHPTLSSSLLAGAQQMDAASWIRLVDTFGPVVYGWCRASGVNESDSTDIVQEVFISVAKGIAKFERKNQEGSFRSWLATITRSRVRDFLRRKAKRDEAIGGTSALERVNQEPDGLDESLDSTICPDAALNTVQRRIMASVRSEFEQATWHAFWLLTVEGRTGAEAAEQLGVSLSSVYQSKSRVLRRLRQRLAEVPQ